MKDKYQHLDFSSQSPTNEEINKAFGLNNAPKNALSIGDTITITYVDAFHKRYQCGGKKTFTYQYKEVDLAAKHYSRLFLMPTRYLQPNVTFNLNTLQNG